MNIDTSIEQTLKKAEDLRVQRRNRIRLIYITCWSALLVGICAKFYGNMLFEGNFTYIFYLFGLAFLLLAPILYPFIRPEQISNNLKEQVVVPIILKQFPDLLYKSTRFIQKPEFLRSGLYPNSDRYKGEDFFIGHSNNVTYKFSQVCAENVREKSNANGSSTLHISSVFKGIFMIADFKRDISSETYVYSYRGKGLFSGYSKVELGYRDFDKRFNVYSNNEADAHSILTKRMMQHILDLREELGKSIYISFKDSKAYIAIRSSSNFFDIDSSSEINVDQIKRILQEIELIISISDRLELGT